ncbi:MAG: DNA alkylation repair protein [Candidatus Nanoarchaeia archaeon]|nr:DNA alkylation repair protein [Candidatus Nanoarchaeia archaeon]
MTLVNLKKDLQGLSNPDKIKILSNFFKTGPGQYGENDKFLGITVPNQRKIAQKYANLNLKEIKTLLNSQIHEHRLTSLLILVHQYQNSPDTIYKFYINNSKNINNWDLVDLTAPKIVGNYLLNKDKSVLYKLAKSKNLWERRIAIVATYEFIKNNKFNDTLKISEILLKDKHDLIHKAVGWMLREVGKKDQKTLENFLKKYHKTMPRTMLRYAIEKFEEKKKEVYMKK